MHHQQNQQLSCFWPPDTVKGGKGGTGTTGEDDLESSWNKRHKARFPREFPHGFSKGDAWKKFNGLAGHQKETSRKHHGNFGCGKSDIFFETQKWEVDVTAVDLCRDIGWIRSNHRDFCDRMSFPNIARPMENGNWPVGSYQKKWTLCWKRDRFDSFGPY